MIRKDYQTNQILELIATNIIGIIKDGKYQDKFKRIPHLEDKSDLKNLVFNIIKFHRKHIAKHMELKHEIKLDYIGTFKIKTLREDIIREKVKFKKAVGKDQLTDKEKEVLSKKIDSIKQHKKKFGTKLIFLKNTFKKT